MIGLTSGLFIAEFLVCYHTYQAFTGSILFTMCWESEQTIDKKILCWYNYIESIFKTFKAITDSD